MQSMLWVLIPLRRGVLDRTLCDQLYLVSSTNKTYNYYITEILLRQALHSITLTPSKVRKCWRYQNGNHNWQIQQGRAIQWPKVDWQKLQIMIDTILHRKLKVEEHKLHQNMEVISDASTTQIQNPLGTELKIRLIDWLIFSATQW
jgi:hypothetical protein